jgi:transposase
MAYSQDIRRRVTEAVASGMACRAAAERFAVGVSTAIRWAQQERVPTTRRPGRPAGRGRLSDEISFLIAAVEATPDITMPELAERLLAERGVTAHPSSLSRLLCRAGFSYKKSPDGRGARAPRRRRAAGRMDRTASASHAARARPPRLPR